MQDRFPSHDVIALTGITARQLQWWDERGVVKPERQGHRRLYSMQNLTEVAVICQLRRKGFSLQGVRKVMRFLVREFGKGLADIVGRNSDVHLLTDGRTSISKLGRGRSSTSSRIRVSRFRVFVSATRSAKCAPRS